jgi:hypothetical protein
VRPLNFTVRRLTVPTYDVVVQGRGISVPVGAGVGVGFFRVVRVTASDSHDASQRALRLAEAHWNASPNANLNRGDAPKFAVDSVAALPWWRCFLRGKMGYTFYSKDDGP